MFDSTGLADGDVYLQPHSDDICFSLGALASRRRAGCLLTVFSISSYVAPRYRAALRTTQAVSERRAAEDAAFAAACGLTLRALQAVDAHTAFRDVWDLDWAEHRAASIAQSLMPILLSPAGAPLPAERPWLFVPAGIGGHVDHVAILLAVAGQLGELSHYYRIGFYEDLHYASRGRARAAGLARLSRAVAGRRLNRHAWRVDEAIAGKCALIEVYASQIERPPHSLKAFTPAAATPRGPHEAVWSEEPAGPA